MVRIQHDLRRKVEEMVFETIETVLGPEYSVRQRSRPFPRTPSEPHLQVYTLLSEVLPFSRHSEFWWRKLGRPFGSMLETSNYSLQAQCRFLCFFYGSVIGLMGPCDSPRSGSMMTIDGSPVELSWVLPHPADGPGSTRTSQKQRCHREVRFAIEPMHPVSGKQLKGAAVLDYLTSPQGSLGLISLPEGGMTWRKKTETFLFPSDDEGGDETEICDGSRFFVGFDFDANGTISLKAYYLPAPSSGLDVPLQERPMALWDVNYGPLRRLVYELDPALMEPLEVLLSYFESLDDAHKPRIQILAMDCVQNDENRLKIYCRPKEGSSWSDAVETFTLGGQLHSAEMNDAVAHMQMLWDHMFPGAPSHEDRTLELPSSPAFHTREEKKEPHIRDLDVYATEPADLDANGIKLNEARHPVGGLLYYYSLFAGKKSVFPKIYLPVTQYCRDDLEIARSVERFYSDAQRRAGCAPLVPSVDWLAKEISNALPHRTLDERTGIHTYVTFAFKKRGWEVTNYFSPEIYS